MNNIELLLSDMKKNRNDVAKAEMFVNGDHATDAERDRVIEDSSDGKSVIIETSSNGSQSSRMLDDLMDEVYASHISENLKAANVGDISTSLESIRKDIADRAAASANLYSIDGKADRDTVAKASEDAIKAVSDYLKTSVTDSNVVTNVFSRMSLNKISRVLPESFVSLYATKDEISSGSKAAKDRIIAALGYVIATGPELDALNDYIEREHLSMVVSERLARCHVDLMEMLKSKEHADELIANASLLDKHEPTVWERYLKDPRAIHSEFARSAAIHMAFADAYAKLLDEYPDDEVARGMIAEQIAESKSKVLAYMDVFELKTLREVMGGLEVELASMETNGKLTPRRLDDMAIKALDRIRRSKQNVPFPAYDPTLGKRPKELYMRYKAEFSSMIENFNATLLKARDKFKDDVDAETDNIRPISIPGQFDGTVAVYFAILLLIAFGRIMKRLDNTDKYNAIMLDNYFRMYCKLGTDIEVMSGVWDMCEPIVKEMMPNGKKQKNRR